MKQIKSNHIVVGALSLIVTALIMVCVVLVSRNHSLRQELVAEQDAVYELLLSHEILEAETYERKLQEEAERLQAIELDAAHYRAVRLVLDEAVDRLGQVFDEVVELHLHPPESFVILPRNRILVSGWWHCSHTEMIHTVEMIFGFWLWNDEMRIEMLGYSPFGSATDWRSPWDFDRFHWAPRHHELDVVPVRFYAMGGDWDEIWYNVEHLDGEAFAEELAYYAFRRLNRIIIDAWFVNQILYVNLHRSEPDRMSSGTFGEASMHHSLVSTLSSVPGIDAFVILVDGQREVTFGGHGMTFRDFYIIR